MTDKSVLIIQESGSGDPVDAFLVPRHLIGPGSTLLTWMTTCLEHFNQTFSIITETKELDDLRAVMNAVRALNLDEDFNLQELHKRIDVLLSRGGNLEDAAQGEILGDDEFASWDDDPGYW